MAFTLCSAQADPPPYAGAWAFELPDGNPAWLKIGLNESSKFEGKLLWSVGSAKPVEILLTTPNRVEFKRRIRWKPGGGKTVKVITSPFAAVLRNGKLELSFEQHLQVDGKVDLESNPESLTLTGKRIPAAPKAPDLSSVRYGEPIELFNGKDLSGWTLSRDNKTNGWRSVNGVLTNETPKTDFGAYGDYGNLVTKQKFSDFRLEIEYNVPKGGNSGIYLRGMYEAQVVDRDSPMQGIQGPGAIFGRIAPAKNAGHAGGEWNRYVLTLVDRHITVELNGIVVIDNQLLEGCTGGGIQADDSAPGPIFLQGDHTSVRYRNILLHPVIGRNEQQAPCNAPPTD